MPERMRDLSQTQIMERLRQDERYSASNDGFYARTIDIIKRGWLRDLTASEGINKIFDVLEKMEIFSNNISLEDIYTISDDEEAREDFERIKNVIIEDNSKLKANTLDFTDIRAATIAKTLKEDPDSIDTMRYFLGMGEITFELVSTVWLFNEGVIQAPLNKISLDTMKRKLPNDEKLCEIVSRHLIDAGLRQRLALISKMERLERRSFIELISTYQTRGRLAKLRGHVAERIIAQIMRDNHIEFEPTAKLTTLGATDVRLPFLNNRLVDFAIPNKEDPKIVIQVAFYTSNTGGVASKTVKESILTKQEIERYNRESGKNIKFIGLIDGYGWIAMSGFLIQTLLCLDDFFQLNTRDRLIRIVRETR